MSQATRITTSTVARARATQSSPRTPEHGRSLVGRSACLSACLSTYPSPSPHHRSCAPPPHDRRKKSSLLNDGAEEEWEEEEWEEEDLEGENYEERKNQISKPAADR